MKRFAAGASRPGASRRPVTTRRPLARAIAAACLSGPALLTVAPALEARDVPFAAQTVVTTTANGANSVAWADVDGDGDADLLSASLFDDTIAWYENSAGDGSAWTAHTVTTAADSAISVAWADVDGDGDADLLSASRYDDTIAWYENSAGDGSTWTRHTVTTTANGARSVAWADVDGDGDTDLLSASRTDDTIAWYENSAGDGSAWTAHTVTTTADGAYSVAWADVDGDGDADLLSASYDDDTIAWYENSAGDGSAWTAHTVTTAAGGALSVAWADVDGDGDADLLSAFYDDDKIAWYENSAGDGSAWTAHTVTTAADGANSVAWADVDGDGDADLLAASRSDDTIAWYENSAGDGSAWTAHTVTTAADGAFSVAWADVDGDGDADLLSASSNDEKIAWYENETIHRSAAFPIEQTVTTAADGARSVAWADVDGDGDADLLSASSNDDKIAWYENSAGDGSAWTDHTVTTTADGAISVAWADVDGDGDADLLSASYNDDMIAWYENSAGDGSAWADHTVTTAADFAASVAWTDVDGDGDADLLSASYNDDMIAWYENSAGDGSAWTDHTVTTAADGAYSVAWADVDGDGDADLLSASRTDDTIAWYENSAGDGSAWTAHTVTTTADGANSVAWADVDGDGDADLLSASYNDDKIAWYENSAGDGSAWTAHTVTTAADGANSVAWADVDGDGDADLLSASFYNDTIAWYENSAGDGSAWTAHTVTTAADGANSVAWADVDGDGDADLLSASGVDDTIAWYPNRGGQFALDTAATAPMTTIPGTTDDLLLIDMVHLGRGGDTDEELATLELLFEEGPGDPLTSTEANALIENLHIYRDEGSGTFAAGTDTLVTSVPNLALTAGVQTVTFDVGDPNVQLAHADFMNTFFVVAELQPDAGGQPPNQFLITHITEASSSAEDSVHGIPLTLEYAANVSSAVTTAGCSGTDLSLSGITVDALTLTCTGSVSITATGVDLINSADITFTAPTIGLNSGFRVEVGSVFRAGN